MIVLLGSGLSCPSTPINGAQNIWAGLTKFYCHNKPTLSRMVLTLSPPPPPVQCGDDNSDNYSALSYQFGSIMEAAESSAEPGGVRISISDRRERERGRRSGAGWVLRGARALFVVSDSVSPAVEIFSYWAHPHHISTLVAAVAQVCLI